MPAMPAFTAAPLAPSSLLSRRRWLLGAALGAALVTAACTGPLGPRSFTLTLEQMQERLALRFPRRYPVAGGLAELNLLLPRLTLLPAQNRLRALIALEASGGVLPRQYTGNMDVDFALRYEPSDQTVRATDLQVHALQIDGLPQQVSQVLGRVGAPLAQQALREVVLQQLRPKDLVLADSFGLQPGPMTITPQGLVIGLVPRTQP